MPLQPGDRLGHYEVLSLLGAGGMGEVYRARDTTLKRDVALKVLPAGVSDNPERMARFQREAEVLASLDHPNIGQIHGIVESESARALALALIEGPTLADRIAAGALPPEEAVQVAKQIIEALEYAHDRGVVHRDLKPANIKINPDGMVKVLDFGLAKVLEDEPASSLMANSPTLTVGHTRAGVILGTAAYMSPEQAVGRPVDRRSDIFSFGAVLYEMLTGERAFAGATTPDVLEAVVKSDPDWTKLPARAPRTVDRLLRRCLVKDRKQRLQAIGDGRILLDGGDGDAESPAKPAVRPQARLVPWAVAALFAILAVAAVIAWAPWRADPQKPLVRLEVDLGADVALSAMAQSSSTLSLSPDGTRLVYLASVAGAPSRLYTRRLDQAKANELPGTQGATGLFFSPDSQWIGFFSGTKLNKISVEGGAVVPLADVTIPAGAAWGEDDSILIAGVVNIGMRRLPTSTGAIPAAKVTDLMNGEIAHVWPQFLPGGKFALFAAYGQTPSVDAVNIDAVPLSGGQRKVMARGGTSPLYLPSGHLVYVNKNTLFAVPFDVDKIEARGNPVPILDDLKINPLSGGADLSFSKNGTLVYRNVGAGSAPNQMTMQWIDAGRKQSPLLAKAGVYANPRLSPDGKRVALQVSEGASADIGIYDPQRDRMTKLTFGGYSDNPIWSPDGRFIIFYKGGSGIFATRADGAAQPQPLIEGKAVLIPWSVSRDGTLAFFEVGAADGWIRTVEITEEGGVLKAGKPARFFESKVNDATPEFSPDGRWIAYEAGGPVQSEVVVRAFPPPASSAPWQVSTNGGRLPHWSRNSRELLYQSGDQIMATSYTVDGGSFQADKPRIKIDKLGGTAWDLAPDGRISVLTPVVSSQALAAEHTVVFLQNFFDELRRRVPLGGK